MAKNQVRIGVGVNDQATKPIKGIRDAFHKLQTQGSKGFAIGAGAAITAKGFSLLDSAASAVIGTLGDSVAAYREDQVSVSKLNQALLANVKGFNGSTSAIEQNLEAGMKLGFADELQRDALTGLVAAYGDQQQALKSLALAQDIARFSGMGLVEASDLLVKVHAGSFRALKSLGIETKGVKNETQALGLIYDKVKGQAAAYAKTSQGKIDAANIRIAESQEKVGKVLDEFWGHAAEMLARAIDPMWAREQDFADARVRLATETTADLEEQAKRRFGLYGDEIDAIGSTVAAQILLERQTGITLDQMQFMASATKDDLIPALVDAGDKTDDFTVDTKQLKSAQDKLEDALQDTTDTLEALSDAMFGAAINAGDLAQAQKDLNEKITEGPASKSAQDIAIYRGEIAELEQSIFDLQAQMAREAGPKAFYDWLVAQKAALGDTNEALSTYIDRLIAAAGIRLPAIPHGAESTGGGTAPAPTSSRTAPRGAIPTFAEGGTVPGPVGAPRLIVAHGGEEVTPANERSGITINLTVQGDIRASSKEDVVRELLRAAAFIRG